MKIDISSEIAELIGTIIGDGCIRYKPGINQYYIEIVGDKEKEIEYFKFLSDIFLSQFNLKSFIKIRERGLRLKVYSRKFVEFLVNDLKLPYNKNKGKNIFIPEKIILNSNLIPHCIRGICDSDGSLFFANKGYRDDYPTIEITTTSSKLAKQLHIALKNMDFRVGFRSFKRNGFLELFIISINGDKMVNKWIKDIGFSNQRNLQKVIRLKKKNGNAAI